MNRPSDLPGAISARYRMEGELGRGGMGRVVAAFDMTIRRRVAIKIAPAPPPGDGDQQLAFQRFRHEAQFAGGLKHENIVGIYDFGTDSNAAWMVMEIVEGGSLRELLSRTEPFSLPETARIMVQLLDGLAFCHDQGIVHCDVKPGNIMLTEPSSDGQVKLADFGIARNFGPQREDPEATRIMGAGAPPEPERIGTPAYMAPEQFGSGPLGPPTDIWAAGVVLYELLTRENPFTGSVAEIEAKVLRREPTPPSQLSVLAHAAFDNVVRKALSKNPGDRYQDARSFSAALLEATRAKRRASALPPPLKPPILTPPPPPRPGWIKFAVAGGVAAAAGAMAFLAIGWPRREGAPPPQRVAVTQPAAEPPPAPPFPTRTAPPAPPAPPAPTLIPSTPMLAPPAPAPPAPPAFPAAPSQSPPPIALTPAVPAPPEPPRREPLVREALRNLADRATCSLMETRREGDSVTITGFVHQHDTAPIREALIAAGLTPRFEADVFDGPYCALLSLLRPSMIGQGSLPSMSARARQIRDGERLTLELGMPDWRVTLNLWFVMHDGQTLHLMSDVSLPPGYQRTLDRTRPDFPWTISEPYGHELVVMTVSDGPLFPSPPPLEENIDAMANALRVAMQRAHNQGRRFLARAIIIETRP